MSQHVEKAGSLTLGSKYVVKDRKIAGTASVASKSLVIPYSLPKNAAKITSARISFGISGDIAKAYSLIIGGKSFVGKSSGSVSVALSKMTGSCSLSASFKGIPTTVKDGTFYRTVTVSDITLTINYTTNSSTGGGGGSGGGGSGGGGQQGTAGYNSGGFSQSGIYAGSDEFPAPPQTIYVFDTDLNKTYVFDGVVKMSHDLTLKMEEEPDEKKAANFTNNARNEPNKVTIEVIMSDVYTTRNDLTNRNEVRSKSAMEVLAELKQSRRKVQVVTTLLTYNNMLLAGISVTQDDSTTHHGWQGQLTFAECYESAKTAASGGSTAATSTTKDSGITNGRTPSVWVSWVGENAIK